MKKTEHKSGRIFMSIAGACIFAAVLIIFAAVTHSPEQLEARQRAPLVPDLDRFDAQSADLFQRFEAIPEKYLAGASSERTLEEYYSRRQYPGSPPFIPHPVEEKFGQEINCLSCHAKGGWAAAYKRHTPVTPHPEFESCRQCHVRVTAEDLFRENDWESVMPPRLGRAHLPGGPPPIPHGLQMRENCLACHVGPGAVTPIRVDHPSRGNCRQCHVPENNIEPFARNA